eukprot:scaffold17531_cov241-Isochrysis_galbana.AAC.8
MQNAVHPHARTKEAEAEPAPARRNLTVKMSMTMPTFITATDMLAAFSKAASVSDTQICLELDDALALEQR